MPISCLGVGPGDSELLTVKAVRLIEEADRILVPVKKEGTTDSTALNIASVYIKDRTKIEYLYFPMVNIRKGNEETEKCFRENGRIINSLLSEGLNLVYLVLGDPNVYSTFSYVAGYIEGNIEYVPGIASFLHGASASGVPLCEGRESLAVINMTDDEELARKIFRLHDNVVVMKVSANPSLLKEMILEDGRQAVFFSNLGQPGEKITSDISYLDDKVPYFTTAQVKHRI